MYEQIPQELKDMPQWVCWRFVKDPGRPEKPRKLPIDARTGRAAQSNNPATWHSFQEAVDAARRYDGIGFMFGGGVFGVDIDGVEREIAAYRDGDVDNIVAEFIDSLGSYAEYSVSGRGIHILCRGTLPPGGRRRGNVEMYESGRFFIMTGNAASTYRALADCTERIRPLHERYIGGGRAPSLTGRPAGQEMTDMDDAELIRLASQSRQGRLFSALWRGEWADYFPSQSEADMALAGMLAFWCRRDEARMDRLFRQSGLYREKWNRRQSGSTYGKLTIHKAAAEVRDVYAPRAASGYRIGIAPDGGERRPPDFSRYTLDDTGNAARLSDAFGGVVRYCFPERRWYYFDSRRWCEDRTGALRSMVDDVVEAMRGDLDAYLDAMGGHADAAELEKAFLKHVKNSRSQTAKTAMLTAAEHLMPVLPEEFDRHDMQLNTPSGVVDLQSGAMRRHEAADMLTRLTCAEYTDRADCPLWESFLWDIFAGDRALIRFVQKAVGYSLTGSTDEQAMFFCVGDGQNGKSTFMEVLADLLGDYAANVQAKTLLARGQTNDISSDIARLKGPRFVTCAEPNEGARLDEGLIKQLTGGDRVTARRLYADEMEFVPKFKIWMGTNHKPVIRGRDYGIWRRLRIIPFDVKIPAEKVDRRLKYKLRAEYPGILRWAVEGCRLWQREGLAMPQAVEDALAEYKSEMDVLAAFLAACTAPFGECQAGELYRVYVAWAKESNEYIMSATKFGREMRKKFDVKTLHGRKIYLGITLNEQYRPYKINIM